MALIERVKQLSQELQANLHHIAEGRLIEIGVIEDPYQLSDEEKRKISQQVNELDNDSIASSNDQDDFSAQLKADWEAENPDGNYVEYLRQQDLSDKAFKEIVAEISTSTNKDELLEIYSIAQEAVDIEEQNYSSSSAMTAEEWQKINAFFRNK